MANLSLSPRSSALCHGARVSKIGIKNLMRVPATKHCQAGVGHEWDHDLNGECSVGDDGIGDVESAAIALVADKYLSFKKIIFYAAS